MRRIPQTPQHLRVVIPGDSHARLHDILLRDGVEGRLVQRARETRPGLRAVELRVESHAVVREGAVEDAARLVGAAGAEGRGRGVPDACVLDWV